MGVDMAATDDHEARFMKEWGKGVHHMLHGIWQRAKSFWQPRVQRMQRRQRKESPLAITNGDEKDKGKDDKKDDEKGEWSKCLAKAQKAKENCILAISKMEGAISSCKKAGRLTNAARKDYEGLVKEVQVKAEKLKKLRQRSPRMKPMHVLALITKLVLGHQARSECAAIPAQRKPATNPCSKGF